MPKSQNMSVVELLKTNPLTEDELARRLEQLKSSLAGRGVVDFAAFVEVFNTALKRHPHLIFGEQQFIEIRKTLGDKIEKRDFRKYLGIVNKNHFALIDVDAEIAQREEKERTSIEWERQKAQWKARKTFVREAEQVGLSRPPTVQYTPSRTSAAAMIQPTREKIDYPAYLKTEAWQIRRKMCLERDDWRCVVCNSRQFLEAHHRTYDRIGNEALSDLTTLCSPCHELFSKNGKLVK